MIFFDEMATQEERRAAAGDGVDTAWGSVRSRRRAAGGMLCVFTEAAWAGTRKIKTGLDMGANRWGGRTCLEVRWRATIR